jgi:hypothetical protein
VAQLLNKKQPNLNKLKRKNLLILNGLLHVFKRLLCMLSLRTCCVGWAWGESSRQQQTHMVAVTLLEGIFVCINLSEAVLLL